MKFINAALVILSVAVAPAAFAQDTAGVRGQSGTQAPKSGDGSMMGGMRGGGMKGGMMGRRGGGMKGSGGLIDESLLVDSTCTDSCGLLGEDTGVLVCRTIGDRSFNKCIDAEEGIESDVCGCCDDEVCPTGCTTSCENDGITGGVLVVKTRRNGRVQSRCVSPLDSVTMLLRNNTKCG
mmetsp:Transcript_2710/g.4382  ORF Transcript_2710/g.4382 Transcript_2710/m.4382 type:complete len:179 (-) Transcript_2710:55-591(-)